MSEEVKKEIPAEEIAEKESAETEKSAKAPAANRISGDARTFFIALLTAVIVVIAYHGIMYWFYYSKCPEKQAQTQNINLYHHQGSQDNGGMPGKGHGMEKFQRGERPYHGEHHQGERFKRGERPERGERRRPGDRPEKDGHNRGEHRRDEAPQPRQ